jgi:hypothetical protein
MATERRDWIAWHRAYDDPASPLSRRLEVVREALRRALDEQPAGPIRVVSMCAGEGRDVIPVVAAHPRRADVRARLVEFDPRNAEVARASAGDAGLDAVEVVTGDAACLDAYAGAVPAEIVLACGVFGNITPQDIRRTIAHIPCLCARGATVIWTRGVAADRDIVGDVRRWFAESGFEEVSFTAPSDAHHRVGVHRLVADPRPLERGVSMFTFFR